MAIPATHRPILVNDDGWIISEAQPPLTARDLKEKMVDTYSGTPLGALLWCLGNREVYDFETRVGEMFGAGYDSLEGLTASEEYTLFDDRTQANRAANIRSLIDERGGPLTAMVELCREAGLDIFPSMRMNSHYDTDPNTPRAGRFRRENPGTLIGKLGETIPQGSLDWGVRTGVDYTHPEVRRHMAGVICELFERFDVDGVELDFMRHPTFFPLKYGYANRHLMTDLVRHVKRRMADVSKNRGRRIDLAVRVPPTLYDANRLGLDVAAWMVEGLVDMVIVGGGFIPFETPVREFVEAAEGTGCLVYGSIERLRPALDDELIRAIAAHHYDQGASGIYLFNYFSKPTEWKRRMFAELADPAGLARLDKRYQMENTRFRWDYRRDVSDRDLHDYAFQNAVPISQLPVALAGTLTEGGPTLRFDIADDVAGASAEGALESCVLSLKLTGLSGEDEMDVWLNGEQLGSDMGKTTYGDWSRVEWSGFPARLTHASYSGATIEFDLTGPPLRKGGNELEVRLLRGAVQKSTHVVLVDVELAISYA